MTIQEMQEASQKRQRAILGAWNKTPTGMTDELLQQYKTAYREIDAKIKATYLKLSGISPDDARYYNELLKYNRLTSLQSSIANDYRRAARAAGKLQVSMGEVAVSNSYYENQYAVNWFANEAYFTKLDENIMKVSVYGTPEIWDTIPKAARPKYTPYLPQYGYLNELLAANAANDLKRISQAITQGLRQGKGYQETAREIRKIFNTTASNAIRIARTEGNRNLNAGAFANSQAAATAGINIQRQYMATRDTRTRDQSGAMDGQVRDVNKPFEYGGLSWFIPGNSGNPAYDINDRCYVIDIVDNKSPELIRERNPVTGQTEVVDFRSFDDYMKANNLTRDKSKRIVFK